VNICAELLTLRSLYLLETKYQLTVSAYLHSYVVTTQVLDCKLFNLHVYDMALVRSL